MEHHPPPHVELDPVQAVLQVHTAPQQSRCTHRRPNPSPTFSSSPPLSPQIPELVERICQHLDPVSLARAARASRAFATARWPALDLTRLAKQYKLTSSQLQGLLGA